MKMGINNKGFSLVELMVVVAIIGILASMGVPALEKQIAKSRQSEAKTVLASLYTSEKAFFAEFATYCELFKVIGFKPEGRYRYNAGYTSAACTLPILQANNWPGAALPPLDAGNITAYCTANPADCTNLANQQPLAAAVLTTGAAGTFTANARSIIYRALVDSWTMTQAKILTNNQDGIQ